MSQWHVRRRQASRPQVTNAAFTKTSSLGVQVVSDPSLRSLFARYRRPLQAFFGKRIGYEMAEELTQETFLRYSQAAAGQVPVNDPAALLFTIAANLYRDHLRRLRRDRAFGVAVDGPLDEALLSVPSGEPLPDETLQSKQELQEVLAAIERLPARCATVFLMHRLQGKSHKEIAAELDISISMVEKHIRRAIEGLLACRAQRGPQ